MIMIDARRRRRSVDAQKIKFHSVHTEDNDATEKFSSIVYECVGSMLAATDGVLILYVLETNVF